MSTLTALMAVPGAGKSTWIEQAVFFEAEVINPDSIREELTGDPSDQQHNGEVFALATERATKALNRGMDVIFDATNVTERARANLLAIAADTGAFARLVVLVVPLPVAKERNAGRERVVPENIIDRMHGQFQESLSQIGHEAWDTIDFERDNWESPD